MKKNTVIETSFDPQQFAQKLKAYRASLNYSQEDLARLLGVSKQTVSAYEKGKSNPSLETLGRIHDYFGADLNYLLVNDSVNEFYDPEIKFNESEIRIIKAYRRCPEFIRKSIRELVYGGQEIGTSE